MPSVKPPIAEVKELKPSWEVISDAGTQHGKVVIFEESLPNKAPTYSVSLALDHATQSHFKRCLTFGLSKIDGIRIEAGSTTNSLGFTLAKSDQLDTVKKIIAGLAESFSTHKGKDFAILANTIARGVVLPSGWPQPVPDYLKKIIAEEQRPGLTRGDTLSLF